MDLLYGNTILTYVTNGNVVEIIQLREILIASLGLIFIPKDIKIDIEDIIGRTKFLPNIPNNMLEQKTDTINKLNNMSETIVRLPNEVEEAEIATPKNNKVKIGYKEYEIIKQPEIIEIKGDYYGKTETDEEKITIASKFSQKIQNQTFLHELLHCIASKYDLPVNQDEHTIELLATGLYEAILDNPHIFTMKDI